MGLDIWMVSAFIAALLSAAEKIAHRFNMRNDHNVFDYTVAFQILCAIISVPIFIYSPPLPPLQGYMPYLYLFMAGLCWALFSLFTFQADKLLEASVKSGVSRLRLIWIGIIGWFFLGEPFSTIQLFGMALICLSPLIIMRFKDKVRSRGIVYELIASIIISLAITFDKISCQYFSESLVLLFSYLNSALLVSLFRKRRANLNFNLFKVVLPSAIFSVFCYLSLLWSLSHGNISTVMSVYMISPIFVTLIGILFLKERGNISLKITSIIIAVIGGVLTL